MGDEWRPGADWWHDDLEEIADYLLGGDEQRAVQLARTILRKWRARRGLPARADDVDIAADDDAATAAAAADDADDAADDDPAAPPPAPVTPEERPARPVLLTPAQRAERAAAEALARQNLY